jgi:hypothetical protein
MTRKANIYILFVIATGLALFALPEWKTDSFPRFASFLALAVLAATFKIRLPGMEGTYSPSFLVILAVLPSIGLAESMTLGCVAALVQTLWRPAQPPRDIQVLFNVAALSLSVVAAYVAFHLAGAHNPSLLPAACAASACVYYLINTGLVSGVICLAERKPLRRVWDQWEFFSLAYYLFGAAFAVLLSILSRDISWQIMVLSAPLAYVLFVLLRRRLANAPEVRQQVASA